MKAKKDWGALFSKEESEHPKPLDEKIQVQQELQQLRDKIKDPEFARKVAMLLSEWK